MSVATITNMYRYIKSLFAKVLESSKTQYKRLKMNKKGEGYTGVCGVTKDKSGGITLQLISASLYSGPSPREKVL